MPNTLATVQSWQDAVNARDAEALIELSDANIEIVGPRGSARGHEVLRGWLSRAGLSLATTRAFARGDAAVLAQRGVWRSAEGNEIIGEADVASAFRVENQKVAEVARYDTLEEALLKAQLSESDEKPGAI